MRAAVLGWVAGLLTFWVVVSVSGGWYSYDLLSPNECQIWYKVGGLPPGSEMIVQQGVGCTLRQARFHLP